MLQGQVQGWNFFIARKGLGNFGNPGNSGNLGDRNGIFIYKNANLICTTYIFLYFGSSNNQPALKKHS